MIGTPLKVTLGNGNNVRGVPAFGGKGWQTPTPRRLVKRQSRRLEIAAMKCFGVNSLPYAVVRPYYVISLRLQPSDFTGSELTARSCG
jgi:hypothetical protein